MNLKENFNQKILNINNIEQYNKNFLNNNSINNFPNLIIFGPSGIGKYSFSLKLIQQLSPSNLKYEKKMFILSNKNEHIIKISDVHYEINFENLTCNSKTLFTDIYNNIIDSIIINNNKFGIILCKNFHYINHDIHDYFYSYMQKIINNNNITIKYILLTNSISFIKKNILDYSNIIFLNKLSITNYKKLCNKNNIKFLNSLSKNDLTNYYNKINNIYIYKYSNLNNCDTKNIFINNKICDNIIKIIINNDVDYFKLRNYLYDILIYNFNIYDSIFYIIEELLKNYPSNIYFLNNIYLKLCLFFKYYNNNYRPIYHLESLILYIINIIHNEY